MRSSSNTESSINLENLADDFDKMINSNLSFNEKMKIINTVMRSIGVVYNPAGNFRLRENLFNFLQSPCNSHFLRNTDTNLWHVFTYNQRKQLSRLKNNSSQNQNRSLTSRNPVPSQQYHDLSSLFSNRTSVVSNPPSSSTSAPALTFQVNFGSISNSQNQFRANLSSHLSKDNSSKKVDYSRFKEAPTGRPPKFHWNKSTSAVNSIADKPKPPTKVIDLTLSPQHEPEPIPNSESSSSSPTSSSTSTPMARSAVVSNHVPNSPNDTNSKLTPTSSSQKLHFQGPTSSVYKPSLYFQELSSYNEFGNLSNSVLPKLSPIQKQIPSQPASKNTTEIPAPTQMKRKTTVEPLPPQKKQKIDKNQTSENNDNRFCCVVCKLNKFDCMLMPCQHVVTCCQCARQEDECPHCSTKILYVLKIQNTLF